VGVLALAAGAADGHRRRRGDGGAREQSFTGTALLVASLVIENDFAFAARASEPHACRIVTGE